MAILTAGDYPAIRAAIDITLDSSLLPDAVIGLSIYAGAAEAQVLDRDPLAESRTGAAGQHVKNAAILLAAARLAPAVPSLTAAQVGGFQFQAKGVDWEKRAADLRGRAEQEIGAVLTPTATTPSRPTMFAAASGKRGR